MPDSFPSVPISVEKPRRRASALLVYACYAAGTVAFAFAAWSALPAITFTEAAASFRFAQVPDRYSMVVMFDADDCVSHETMITALNQVHDDGDIPVRGVLVGAPNATARRDAILDLAPRFPLLSGAESAARQSFSHLGYLQTPTVAVIDAEGRPVMVIQPNDLPWKEADAVRLAAQFITSQRSEESTR